MAHDMSQDEKDLWDDVTEYQRQFSATSFSGTSVAAGLALRREANDMFAELAENASLCADTDDTEDYQRWLQSAADDVSSQISFALGNSRAPEESEDHLRFAYAILREVAADALTRKPATTY